MYHYILSGIGNFTGHRWPEGGAGYAYVRFNECPLAIFDYRRRLEYGLINDPSTDISDVELISEMKAIRQNTPYCGVSMMYGSLRARGVKVTRERVRTSLRSIDPIGSALRWPAGLTKRRPYSVAGPNSLWHISNHGVM